MFSGFAPVTREFVIMDVRGGHSADCSTLACRRAHRPTSSLYITTFDPAGDARSSLRPVAPPRRRPRSAAIAAAAAASELDSIAGVGGVPPAWPRTHARVT